MAQMYIQQMTERHAVNLLDFQRALQVSDRLGARRRLVLRRFTMHLIPSPPLRAPRSRPVPP